PEGFTHVPYNDLDAMAEAIDTTTVALMVEPIQGEGGVVVPDKDYLPGLRALCDEHDLVLIIDEVWTGGGRTGQWFAHQHFDVTPDIMTLAKGVGGGLPVGVMCAGDRVADLYDVHKQGGVKHATTLGGNCLGMAAGAAIFEVIERDGLLDHARALNEQIRERMAGNDRPAGVVDVRGLGAFIGIELNLDAFGLDSVSPLVHEALDKGLMVGSAQGRIIRLAPPLTLTESQLSEGLDTLVELLETKGAS
ncbi:MAG: aminotransferase class III-fold pyridoxal phosphate-dependent enzyme, partial [Phycisphaeraceae bacterium]|nr:aminotransferase class III-fold pyridoxal phosphate-dependent enzyme [Phycisphaeraceae bacterium]